MTSLTTPIELQTPEERAALPPLRVLADIGLLAGRNLRRVMRNTGLIVFSTIQPLMQLILFAYVFTAVADIGAGIGYREFIVPAILVQSIVFASMGSGVGVAYDLESGMIDRFRAMPIARSAFLVGRTVSDSLRLGIQVLLLVVASLVIGFAFLNGVLGAIGMIVVVVLFGAAGIVHPGVPARVHELGLRTDLAPPRVDAAPGEDQPRDLGNRLRPGIRPR
jgi:hypothetical protein